MSKGILHKIDNIFTQCSGLDRNTIQEVSNLDGYTIGSSLAEWGCQKYNPSKIIILEKIGYKNGIVNNYYVLEDKQPTNFKEYKFYFDFSDQYVVDNWDKFSRQITNRNWASAHQIESSDLLCLGHNSPANYSPGEEYTDKYLFNPARDSYIINGKYGGTNWEQANNDFYENKQPQASHYFSGPKIYDKGNYATFTKSCGGYMNGNNLRGCKGSAVGQDGGGGYRNKWTDNQNNVIDNFFKQSQY